MRKSLTIASIAAIGGCSLIAASAAKPPLMVLAYKSSSFAADYDSIADKDLISGRWRGVLNDEGVELSLNKNGSLKAVYNHKKENGKWDLKEDHLEMEIGNKKYTFTYDRAQDAILYDGNYIFKRLSDIAEDDNNAEVRIDAVSGEFLGKWKAVNLENTKGEISVYPDVLKATTVTLEISEKKADKTTGNRAGDLSMDLKIHGDTDKSTISGISSTFTMGAITFQIANPIESSIIETGKRSDGKVFIINFKHGNPTPLGIGRRALFLQKNKKSLIFLFSPKKSSILNMTEQKSIKSAERRRADASKRAECNDSYKGKTVS